MSGWPSTQEIIGTAFDANNRDEFRQQILRRLVAAAGGEAGFFANPSVAVQQADVLNLDPAEVEAARKDYLCKPSEGLRALQQAIVRNGAAIDTQVLGTTRQGLTESVMVTGSSSVLAAYVSAPGAPASAANIAVARRGGVFPPAHAKVLARLIPALSIADAALTPIQGPTPVRLPASLTERQREICDCVIRGMTNAEIARQVGISLHTVRNHLAVLFDRFDVLTRTELATHLLMGSGELSPEPWLVRSYR